MSTRPTPMRASAHHEYKSWTCTWYDDQGSRRTKRFGRVGTVAKKIASGRYDTWMKREWQTKPHVRSPGDPKAATVEKFARAYHEHAKTVYRKNGKETHHMSQVASAMNWLIEEYGAMPVDSLGTPELTRLRDKMITGGRRKGRPTTKLGTSTINGRIRIIKQAFAWGRAYNLVSRETAFDISLTKYLRDGRCEALPTKVVVPVKEDVLEKTLKHLPQTVADMVRIQLLTGMRPGELCGMRACDIDRTDKTVWVFRPEFHKTEHKGKSRAIAIGPQAQAILMPYLDRRIIADYVFLPAESHRERLEAIGFAKVTAYQVSRSAFKPGRRYTNDTYRNVIQRACDRAFDPDEKRRGVRDFSYRWHPHQLRHNAATRLRREFGLEAAADALGHSSPSTTLVYAEKSLERQKEVARKVG